MIDEKYDTLFSDFDKDQNGVITKNEMFDFLVGLFGVEAAEIDIERVLRKDSILVPQKLGKDGWDSDSETHVSHQFGSDDEDSPAKQPPKVEESEEQVKQRQGNIVKLLELIDKQDEEFDKFSKNSDL